MLNDDHPLEGATLSQKLHHRVPTIRYLSGCPVVHPVPRRRYSCSHLVPQKASLCLCWLELWATLSLLVLPRLVLLCKTPERRQRALSASVCAKERKRFFA